MYVGSTARLLSMGLMILVACAPASLSSASDGAAPYGDGVEESSDLCQACGWTFGYDDGFVIASPQGRCWGEEKWGLAPQDLVSSPACTHYILRCLSPFSAHFHQPRLVLDADDSAFLMRIGSWGQLRHALSLVRAPNANSNRFEWERIRLVLDGHAWSRDFQYFLQYDGDSDDAETVELLDYYLTYDVGHDACCWDRGHLAVRLGKWKIPFARSREESGTRLEFADRSMAGVFFDFNRSVGVGLLGHLDGPFVPLDWHVAITNGINTGGFRTGRSDGALDRNFAVSGRVTSLVCGDYGSDGEPDLMHRDVPAWRIGTGFACTRVDREGMREFSNVRVVDSGATIDTVLPPAVTGYDYSMFAVDSHVKYRGASVIAEYFFRYLSRFSGAPIDGLFDHGMLLQMGYFVVPSRLELLARWSRIVGNSGTLGATQQSADEIAAGVVWYLHGHNLKITADATRLNGAPNYDSALNVLPGDDGWLLRTQFQFKF